jgi:hypothetical protein
MSPSSVRQQAPEPEILDASKLPDKYPGRRINTLFIKDMSNVSNAIRDVPIHMTVGDFIQYAANQMGIPAAEMRLLYGPKQLTHGNIDHSEDGRVLIHPIIGSKVLLMDYDVNEASSFRSLCVAGANSYCRTVRST